MIVLLTKLVLVLALADVEEPTAFEIDALRETAPNDLSPNDAREHLVDARTTARAYDVDEADLLAIAHHESRYTSGVSTNEGPGSWWEDFGAGKIRWASVRWSCGVMTPWPHLACAPWELTTIGGYFAGAAHLAYWKKLCRGNRLCALRGYSGNSWDGQTREHVRTWVVFVRRAARIRSALADSHKWSRTRIADRAKLQ